MIDIKLYISGSLVESNNRYSIEFTDDAKLKGRISGDVEYNDAAQFAGLLGSVKALLEDYLVINDKDNS